MKKLLLAGVMLLAGAAPSWAQQPPYGSGSTELTGTISTSGTYQQVFAASSNGQRKSCLVENTSASNQFVFFGPTAPSPNSGKGLLLVPNGGWVSCGLPGGGVAIDAVWIEGASGATYEYISQP